jgi:hypothetical protein
VSAAVSEYAWEGGLVSSKDCRCMAVFSVSDLVWEDEVGMTSPVCRSKLFVCEWDDRELLFGFEMDEFSEERFKLP